MSNQTCPRSADVPMPVAGDRNHGWPGREQLGEIGQLMEKRPLRVLFLTTSMPVGGAETLLTNLVRQMDPGRFRPEIGCLKQAGVLGDELAAEFPVHGEMLAGKYDVRILGRLVRLLRTRQIDAVVTVGAGDKMFWGRLAAWQAGCPVVLSALHSTGWPDQIGTLNRWLTRLTDRFIAVADRHGRYLVQQEHLPAEKVVVIPNGVDTQRFRPRALARTVIRQQLQIEPTAPLFGIVAALRPEKNHLLFLEAAAQIVRMLPSARFLIVGDGPERRRMEERIEQADLGQHVRLLGNRADVPELLAAMDLFVLTSDNEANPVSILEALATGLPVVATNVGSVAETVDDDVTGFLVPPGDASAIANRCLQLASDRQVARLLGENGRERVAAKWSLQQMVQQYEQLITEIYAAKSDDVVSGSAGVLSRRP